MSVEEKKETAKTIGTLSGCLIEGDSEQKSRERKVKRRALGISIALQSAVIVVLVLVPLLGRTEKISLTNVMPIPPYRAAAHHPSVPDRPTLGHPHPVCVVCFNSSNPPRISTGDNYKGNDTNDDTTSLAIEPAGPPNTDGLNILNNRRGPQPPQEDGQNRKKRIVLGGSVQQAMLIHRVEPAYPALPHQLGRSGQVQLRAIIATDGTIQSLQVVSGDPLFLQSALDAVRQWRYRPTSLNGLPVEVETIITVVYTLQR